MTERTCPECGLREGKGLFDGCGHCKRYMRAVTKVLG